MQAVDEIYEAIGDETAYARIPMVLARATGARSAIALELNETMQSEAWVRYSVSDDIMDRYASLDLWRHDLWSHLMARPSHRNRAVRSDEVIDADTFRGSVFFNELYRPLGDDTARCLGVVLDRPGGSLAIGLHRAFGQPAFDAREVAALQDIVPHLRRVLAARYRLRKVEDRAGMLSAALDGLAYGALILGPDLQLLHANRAAEYQLRKCDCVALWRGRVMPLDTAVGEKFAEAVRSAATATAKRGGAMLLRRPVGTAVRVMVTPSSGSPAGALVLLDSDTDGHTMTHILGQLFDLTQAEAEVAELFRQGLSPQQVATRRGVRLSTVRSQIQSLLDKAEARSLGDLERTLGRVSSLGGR